jgi:hypothetical protein
MSKSIKSNEMERFTQISNRAVRDDELGAVALAIYTYIRSHSAQNYTIYKRNVELRFQEIGRVSFNRAWKSLIDKGWLTSNRVKDEHGRYTKWNHYVIVENENYRVDEHGKSSKVTDLHIDDFRLDDSHEDDSVNNTNIKNKKNKKYTSISIDNRPVDKKVTKIDGVPYDQILDAFKQALPNLPQPRKLTEKRKRAIRKCWQDDAKHQNIEFWKNYFYYTSKSPFLMGQEKKWQADFDFLTKVDNMVRVIEGTYHRDAG